MLEQPVARRGYLGRLVVGAALVALCAAACGDDEQKTAAPSGPAGGPGPGSGGGGDGGSAGPGGAGGVGGVPIDDTQCVSPAVAEVEVYPASAGMRLEQLVRVGARWVAGGGEGFVYFDGDGSNADASTTQVASVLNIVADDGDWLGVAGAGDSYVQYQRFDENGAAVSVAAGVTTEAARSITVASVAGAALVSWGFNTQLKARRFTSDNAWDAPAFVVRSGAFSSFMFVDSAAHGSDVGIVWSSDPDPGLNQTQFVLVDAAGVPSEPVLLLDTPLAHSVAQMAATDDGYVVLLTGEPPDAKPLLLLLDETGHVSAPVASLEGAKFAYGVASQGDSFAVLVGRETGEPQLRAFDLSLQPLGAWVCLGSDHDVAVPPAISADGSGYAAIHTSVDGAVRLQRTDRLGTGAP